MNPDELRKRFPRASEHVLRLNAAKTGKDNIQPDSARPIAKLERHPRNGAVGALPIQKRNSRQVLISITAVRTRLLDEDNLAAKFHIDLLRYASGGALGDSPATTRIEIRQQKAQAGEREEVR